MNYVQLSDANFKMIYNYWNQKTSGLTFIHWVTMNGLKARFEFVGLGPVLFVEDSPETLAFLLKYSA